MFDVKIFQQAAVLFAVGERFCLIINSIGWKAKVFNAENRSTLAEIISFTSRSLHFCQIFSFSIFLEFDQPIRMLMCVSLYLKMLDRRSDIDDIQWCTLVYARQF